MTPHRGNKPMLVTPEAGAVLRNSPRMNRPWLPFGKTATSDTNACGAGNQVKRPPRSSACLRRIRNRLPEG